MVPSHPRRKEESFNEQCGTTALDDHREKEEAEGLPHSIYKTALQPSTRAKTKLLRENIGARLNTLDLALPP